MISAILKKKKKVKTSGGTVQGARTATMLHRVVKRVLTEKVTCEQSLKK